MTETSIGVKPKINKDKTNIGFSQEWEQRYKENTHMSIWPWSDLVSLVYRYGSCPFEGKRVLELGCGAGANIPFFKALGVEYYAVEGSETIVDQLHGRFPELKNNICTADFTSGFVFDGPFDIIVDRASLTHNKTKDILSIVSNVHDCLMPGGLFIGVDWFSKKYSEYSGGQFADCDNSRVSYKDGPFANVGLVHYADKGLINQIFKDGFEIIHMEEKIKKDVLSEENYQFASFDIVATKR